METDIMAIAPVTLFAFGPDPDFGGEEPDETEQEEKPQTEAPKREEAPKTGEKTEHPHPHESNRHLQ
ncbi:MAG: hypothetical protein LC793_12780 [Thermomicrobia bacterium]|nr:hypothetical protein [Thermomicrobia bacterium]MCA1725169.1 hypothetical protein [Thermomicrobia bacterium]